MRDAGDNFTITAFGRGDEAQMIPWGDLYLPARFWAVLIPDDESLPAVSITCEVERGRTICVNLRCERRENGPAISGTTLRELPLGTYTRAATRAVARRLVFDGEDARLIPAWGRPVSLPESWDGDTPVYGDQGEPIPEHQRFESTYARQTGSSRRRGPLRGDELDAIADVYRRAVAAGEAATRAVASEFGVSRSTAGRWIAEARRRGKLGRALPRMAGENSDE